MNTNDLIDAFDMNYEFDIIRHLEHSGVVVSGTIKAPIIDVGIFGGKTTAVNAINNIGRFIFDTATEKKPGISRMYGAIYGGKR